MKRWYRNAFETRLAGLGVSVLEKIPDRHPNLLRVLTYHRVANIGEDCRFDPALISATPAQFERHIEYLLSHYCPVSLADVINAIAHGTPLPPRAVLVAFDDAYQDFKTNAWPVLSRRNVPVVVFVPTAFPDGANGPFWWDRLYCAVVLSPNRSALETCFGSFPRRTEAERRSSFRRLKQHLWSVADEVLHETLEVVCDQSDAVTPEPRTLSWDELRYLASEGVALAPHTRSHPLLTRIPLERAREEICRSRDDLRAQIGHVPPAFAFPSGFFNPEVIEVLREEGFQVAFSTVRGINDLSTVDPLRMRRTHVGIRSPNTMLRFQLLAPAVLLNGRIPQFFPARPN